MRTVRRCSACRRGALHVARGGDRVRRSEPPRPRASRRCSSIRGSLERALVPYVVASQTVPIIALAPMIVFALGPGVMSVVVIATYLTFFPVTIAMIRGLRSFDPRALELMRSYAASRRRIYTKLRLPASMPYLFTALKIAATASIVGRDHRRGRGGHPDGLGRASSTSTSNTSPAPRSCGPRSSPPALPRASPSTARPRRR